MVEDSPVNRAAQAAFAAVGAEHVSREGSTLDLLILRAKHSKGIGCLEVKHPIVGTRCARDKMKGGKIERDLVPTRPSAPASAILESCRKSVSTESGRCGDRCPSATRPVRAWHCNRSERITV
jgi:hypothetical protein